MSRTYTELAIAEEESKLEAALGESRNLLVEAPTGSGKSLYIPWFLSRHCEGRVVVLQPRRIAALSLAQYSAKLHNEPCGKTVGYQFRQDTCKSAATRILFQTYGNFLQELLHGKLDAEWVIFDEYHERKADMDLLFSYLLALQRRENDSGSAPKGKAPRIAVMSAKLNRDEMENALGVKCLELGHPLYPVQILHQIPQAGSTLESEVVKALKSLYRSGVWKTTLVFLPGKAEISKCHSAAEESLGSNTAEYLDLFGGQERDVQDRIFEETERPRVIFTTNIAETSITVPNVSGVVDSGVERISEYDDSQKVNVLRTAAISMQNAIQRSGRSGRTQNGACIRLWSEDAETRMPRGIVPEVTQIEPSEFLLQEAALEYYLDERRDIQHLGRSPLVDVIHSVETRDECGCKLKLPTAIPEKREAVANELLQELNMLADGKITDLGLQAVQSPLSDVQLAYVLIKSKAEGISELTLATMAWIHGGTEALQKNKLPTNLMNLASDTAGNDAGSANRSNIPREVSLTLRQLQDYCKRENYNRIANNLDSTVKLFLEAYPDRLATPTSSSGSYKLTNQNIIRIQQPEPPFALLAMTMLRTSSSGIAGAKTELRLNLYVPVAKVLLESENVETRYELIWRNGQERFIGKEIRGAAEREIIPQEASLEVLSQLKELTVDAWKEKLDKENWTGRYLTENLQTLLIKMRLAAKLYPEFGLPEFNEEDMELIFDEFANGIFLLRDLNEDRYRAILEDYFGRSMLQWLHKTFPDHYVLPNGKKARYSYQEVDVPEPGTPGSNLITQSAEGILVEVSARIEDLMQLRGEHKIADGKLKVRYDILAPNFRTIQKTWDLTGFWQNTYAEVRKELRGRYPKHPWPEAVI